MHAPTLLLAMPNPALANILPHSIGPYLTLMLAGFATGILGHLMRVRWLIALGVMMVFLGAFLFPLALNVTTPNKPPVLNYPPGSQ